MSEELGMQNKKSDFNEWYNEVIQKAGIADYSSVSGCMVIKPYAFAMWDSIRNEMDKKLKEIGVQNAYFPLLIPERLLTKESQHIEGFTPEVAWVTHSGDNEMEERLAIRPTSETIMYESFSNWVRSWRDLPLRINQWVNVLRWEFKHPQLFLRTREFLWQEGHTVHATRESALEEIDQIREIYRFICEDYMAIPATLGRKTEKEKFAGAEATFPLEHMMPNGKVIQGPDAHLLGQNFSKAFDIKYFDEDGKEHLAWQNSWGFSTRELGVMFGIHGDDKGLIAPPRIAPIQAVVIPIFRDESKDEVMKEAKALEKRLGSVRTHLDSRDHHTPGYKFNEWELKGVPLRIEIGPKDIENRSVVLVRRDTGEKMTVDMDDLKRKCEDVLELIQENLFQRAKEMRDSLTFETSDYNEALDLVKKGRVLVPYEIGKDWEERIKTDAGAKASCIIEDNGIEKIYFARSY